MKKTVLLFLFLGFVLNLVAQSRPLQYYIKMANEENKNRLINSTNDVFIESVSLDKNKYESSIYLSEELYNEMKSKLKEQRGALIMALSKNVDNTMLEDFEYYKISFVYVYKALHTIEQLNIDIRPQEVIGYKLFLEANKAKSIDEKIEMLEKAMKNGNIEAYERLAYYYENGYVVKQDFAKSYQYYKYLSEHPDDVVDWYMHGRANYSYLSGNPYLYHIAWQLYRGLGCDKNQEKAIDLYKKLAKDGHVESSYYVGEYYYQNKRYEEAVPWLEIRNYYGDTFSAQAAKGRALRLLSACYRYGLGGVKLDKVVADSLLEESYKLYNPESYNIFAKDNLDNENFKPQKVDIKMVFVEGGIFQMGATKEQYQGINKMYQEYGFNTSPEEYCYPVINVNLDDYYIGEHEVTQKEWYSVMGYNNSSIKGDNYPVHNICWYEAQEFIKRLNLLTGRNYRLPTEAEWEFAARGGKYSKNYMFIGSDQLEKNNPIEIKIQPVCGKMPNELGLYDMEGNVVEWCNDWMGGYGIYKDEVVMNPLGETEKNATNKISYTFAKIVRGGNVGLWSRNLASDRRPEPPARRHPAGGFRLCESIKR